MIDYGPEGRHIPEGPEIFVASKMLGQSICGVPIVGVSIGSTSRYASSPPKGYARFCESVTRLSQFRIESVNVHGKFMWWSFRDAAGFIDTMLLCTHGMSGRWFICDHADVKTLRHVVVSFDLQDGRSVVFVDPRHFGTIRFGNASDVLDTTAALGDDIRFLNTASSISFVSSLMKARSKTVCEALMDQYIIAGIGNYIKAEVLWRVKLSPWRIVRDITPREFSALQWAIVDVFEIAVASRGASFSTHLNPDGKKGQKADFFQVYGKKFDPNGFQISRQKTPDGRVTHWVVGVQV